MSFFKKMRWDAVSFKDKTSKKEPKTKKKFSSESSKKEDFNGSGKSMVFNKCNNIHFGNSYTLSATHITNTHGETKCTEDNSNTIPPDVEDNFSRIDEPTMDHFILVSQNVTHGWKELGLKLGFNNSDLKEFSSEEEDILRLLIAWKQAETRLATVGRLICSLWEVREYEAAQRLSAYISSQST